jgi:cobalt-zinc-cadmium efflux system outer membrane protein
VNKMLVRLSLTTLIIFLVGCSHFDRKAYQEDVASGVVVGTGYTMQFSTTPGESVIPKNVDVEDGIDEDETVILALWNNAAYQELLSDLGFARADYIKAGLLPNPVLSLLFPVADRNYESSFSIALDAIWLRPQRLSVAELQTKQICQRLVQNGLDLVRDVRIAFVELEQAKNLAEIGEESADLRERIASLSEKRLKAGDISELEMMTARIEAKSARANAAMLKHNVDFARQKLVSLIGLSMHDSDLEFQELSTRTLEEHEIQSLLHEALLQRPDYRAAKLAVEAAGEKHGLAKIDILKISAQIDGDEISNDFQLGPGFKLELPIFSRNQDGIALAQAEIEKAVWHSIALRNQIHLEVQQAYTSFIQTRENLRFIQTQIITGLQETVAQAEKAYENGNISLLMVLDTTNRLLTVREQEAKSEGALLKSIAELERSVGKRLDTPPALPSEQ